MHSTGLLKTLLVMQCTQSHMDSASAEKGRLLAKPQKPCTSKLTKAHRDSAEYSLSRCNQVEMASAQTRVHLGPM